VVDLIAIVSSALLKMNDEKPVQMRKRRPSTDRLSGRICIVHYAHSKQTDTEVRQMTDQAFQIIKNAAFLREKQDNPCYKLLEICHKIPAQLDSEKHGMHRWCYRNFTNVGKLKKLDEGRVRTLLPGGHGQQSKALSATSGRAARRYRPTADLGSSSLLFLVNECLFCHRGRNKKLKRKVEGLVKCVTVCAENRRKLCAKLTQDSQLLGKIDGQDLRAREARYHESCRRTYCQNAEAAKTAAQDTGRQQRDASNAAFEHVCAYIQDAVIVGHMVVRMTMLRDRYLAYIQEQSPDFYNPAYQTHVLKERLVRHFKKELTFSRTDRGSELVFASTLDVASAIRVAFEATASENRMLEEAAIVLNRHITCMYHNSPEMPWPPSASYLNSDAMKPPEVLTDFITMVITGKNRSSQKTNRTQVTSESIAEDLCSAATRSRWKLPKHLLLAMSLRHLTGSAQIITMINRYGHCRSYSQIMEVETAMAQQIQQEYTLLPCNISTTGNKVSKLCWDNIDFNEETPSGFGISHNTHGILIQELTDNASVSEKMRDMKIEWYEYDLSQGMHAKKL
jgi:hypothetical protein